MSAHIRDVFANQGRVIGALILRDMRTRFGRSFMGYVIIVGWPLAHLLALVTGYLLTRRVAPVGTSVPVFLGTGILPYILCLYPSRMIMLCLAQNHPLLYFPIVKTTDVIIARSVLEILTAFWVVAIFALILYIAGIDITPLHYKDAVQAILATIYLGFAIGFLGAVFYKLTKAWLAFQIGTLIAMYIASGVFFIPTNLSDDFQFYLWFNPLLHSVEWLRSAYYDGYGYGLLDRGYLIGFATVVLAIGMVSDRFIRGRLLQI
jgi:capsular polysaccharide transport system permease protein